MMGDLQAHLPTLCCVFSSFWPKMAPCSTLPIHPILPQATFFVSLDKRSPQREMFCQCGRGETKNGRSRKRHQNWWVQKLFWRWLKVLKFKYVRINTQFFINKFCFGGSPLYSPQVGCEIENPAYFIFTDNINDSETYSFSNPSPMPGHLGSFKWSY